MKSPQWIRELKFKKRPFWRIDKFRLNNIIDDGGWHFCNLKSPKQLLYKYRNLCETYDPYSFGDKIDENFLEINSIKNLISQNKDLIGRDHLYEKVEIDNSYPEYFRKNLNIYKKWIS